MPAASELQALIGALIEDFGKAYADFGQPMLKGRLVGLLMTSDQPLSLEETCQRLGVSKASVSVLARQLEDSGLIRRLWVKNDRKDYYQIDAEPFLVAARHNLRLIENNLTISRRYQNLLRELTPTKADKVTQQHLLKRMEEMEAFYSELVKMFSRFIENWQRKRQERI
jgi:DNA-binding transcriptional regulator GbsR (MarR family)